VAEIHAVLNQGQFASWFYNSPLSEEFAADGEVLDTNFFGHGIGSFLMFRAAVCGLRKIVGSCPGIPAEAVFLICPQGFLDARLREYSNFL